MNATSNVMMFQGVSIKPLHREGQTWLRMSEVEAALGYVAKGSPLARVFSRHADEFTASMTRVVKLGTAGGKQAVRIFSLRGAHLLAMFARTEVAKAFRVWVLDILDAQIAMAKVVPPSRYHYPLESCKPMPRNDGFDHTAQLDLTTLADPRNPRPELELLRQLERDGHDVRGARVRIVGLYNELRLAMMTRRRMAVWEQRLKNTCEELVTYQGDMGPGVIFSQEPEGIMKSAFASQLPNWNA